MRLVDANSLKALEGSRPADEITVWAWRDGELLLPDPLQVISWSVEDAAGDSVKVAQQLSLTVADPDGTLGAWRLDDPLGVAGTKLQVVYRVGGAGSMNYAWFRVTGNQPSDSIDWRTVQEYGLDAPGSPVGQHQRDRPIVAGTVKIDAADITVDVQRDRLEYPESPEVGATVLSEFRRLTAGYFPVVVDPGVTDTPISTLTVWDRERLDAAQDALARIGARHRMGGDGECHVYARPTVPVWRVGPRQGLVQVSRKQSLDGLYNRWIVEGKDKETGDPVRGTASIRTGPLRYGGPAGRAQFFYSSEMIESHDQAVAYARELRDKFLATLSIDLVVETVPRPELQGDDMIEVGCPVAAGYIAWIPGLITNIRRSGDPIPNGTTLTVSCSYQAVDAALSRTDWAADLGHPMPDLTWDRMPATWGELPALPWDELP